MFDTNETAVFTEEHGIQHRVWLRRHLSDGPFKPAVFALHNPSIAGKIKNDPTATRGVRFAMAWGCSDLIFVNAATQIATKATDLNPDHLNCAVSNWAVEEAARLCAENDGFMVAAWGSPKGKAETCRRMAARFEEIEQLLRADGYPLHYLRLSPHGWPEHPLYLPSELTPTLWSKP